MCTVTRCGELPSHPPRSPRRTRAPRTSGGCWRPTSPTARAQTPPQDAHALDLDGLLDPAVRFFALRADGELLAIGALKRLDAEHGEIKSMHTARAARGRGLGRAMLDHLLATAHELGMRRVSLETGSMAAFAPARALYAGAGFAPCAPYAPFGDYAPSINSAFMTLDLPRRTLPQSSLGVGVGLAVDDEDADVIGGGLPGELVAHHLIREAEADR